MWKCINCGEQGEDNHKYCWNCSAFNKKINDDKEISDDNASNSAQTELKFVNPKYQQIAAFAKTEIESNSVPPSWNEFSAVGFLILGVVLFILGNYINLVFVSSLESELDRDFAFLLVGSAFTLATLFCIKRFFYLERRARRYTLKTLASLQNETRDPILYLRPFTEDLPENSARVDLSTNEELIASVFKDYGPVLTIGLPEDKDSPLGAIRIYLKDEDWHKKVLYLMSVSRCVVVEAGISKGLKWEIANIMRVVPPERLLLSFISWHGLDSETRAKFYEDFCKNIKNTKLPLPQTLGYTDFIYYDYNGKPFCLNLEPVSKFLGSLPYFFVLPLPLWIYQYHLSGFAIRRALYFFLYRLRL